MFKSARLKLTVWYLVIIMLISLFFSIAIYKILTHEFERSEFKRLFIERQGKQVEIYHIRKPRSVEQKYLEALEARIRLTLVYINIIILVASTMSGYFLAGKTLNPIKDMIDEQNRFIADASHELRTPLTGLKTSLEVYNRQEKHTAYEINQLTDSMLEEVNSLQFLTDNLIDLAQYQENGSNNKLGIVPLKKVLKDARKKIEPFRMEKNINIIDTSEETLVKGDYNDLARLFVIFLDNAIKYSPPKSTIEIETKTKNNMVTVSIKDNGIGISEKYLNRIFDRFYRVDTSRTRNDAKGYGLGLSIAQKIVKSHKGSISVKSRENKGTTFYITLQEIKEKPRESSRRVGT